MSIDCMVMAYRQTWMCGRYILLFAETKNFDIYSKGTVNLLNLNILSAIFAKI